MRRDVGRQFGDPVRVTLTVQGRAGSGNGSGEIIRAGGYVLTNHHVDPAATRAGGGRIDILFSDGSSQPATVVCRAPAVNVARRQGRRHL